MPVTISVEEDRVDVFGETVRRDRRLLTRPERAVTILNEEPPRLPFGAAGIEVIEYIAVHVAHSQRWALSGEQMWNERLPLVVVEHVLVVLEIDRHAIGHVAEQRRGGRVPGGGGAAPRATLRHTPRGGCRRRRPN